MLTRRSSSFIPVALVILGVALFLGSSSVTSREKTPEELLVSLRGRGINKPWQAAFELARRLYAESGRTLSPEFSSNLISAFEESASGDLRIRCFLALALANVRDPRASNALQNALKDPSSEVRIHALIALGISGQADASPDILPFLESGDPGEVKAALCALGMLRSPAAHERLGPFLESDSHEIRWNAALALASFDDPAAVPVLMQMLDPRYLESLPASRPAEPQQTAFGRWGTPWPFGSPIPTFDEGQRLRVIRQALAALARLKPPEAQAVIRQLLADPREEIRWSAALALAEFPDAAGLAVIEARLDRRTLLRKGCGHEASSEILKEAIVAAGRLRQPSSVAPLEKLKNHDPDPEVRKLAERELAGF
ncbi:MAG: HEAT repeat domain-containing protein [Planctomycetes bacterium]|nr:HEAT repeat domain-containing protein [Planctomycetota bacterium]